MEHQAVIDGYLYDTEAALLICSISPSGYSRTDFKWEETYLYQTKNGRFFIAGEGGASTRWAEPVGDNGRQAGYGLKAVSIDDAKAMVESHGAPGLYVRVFGPPEEA